MKRAGKIWVWIMILVLCISFPSVNVSALRRVTQQQAVDWLWAQNGAWYDLDGAYGAQCSDFVSAYMNWLLDGDPYSGAYGVYNAYYYNTVASWRPDAWEIIENSIDFLPLPGDIFVSQYGDYGHVGVVISSDIYNATVIDQNYINANYTSGSAAYIHDIAWKTNNAGYYGAAYFIRYKGFQTDPVIPDFGPYEGAQTYIYDTDASIGQTISGDYSEAGMYLYNNDGALLGKGVNYFWSEWGYVYFKINEEVGVTLEPATTYKYKFYAKLNGTEYTSPIGSFTTTGYTVTFDANGGSSVPPRKVLTGGTVGSLPTTTRAGYDFTGWYTSKTGGTKLTTATIINANVTYYAQWTPKTYTVSYNANGGSGAPAAQTKTHDVALTISGTVPVRNGYTFQGWATSATATSAQYQPGGSYSENENVTLYAVWKKDEAPVTDGSITVGSASAQHGSEVSIPVSITGNTGIASFQFDVIYDDTVLEWIGLEKASIGGTWDAAVGESILWIDADNYTADGTLFTLKFRIKDEAGSGTTQVTLSYDPNNVFDENGANVSLGIAAGTVTVFTHTPGDINGDGTVNNKDLLWLMKWIKGKPVEVVYEALDINGDGNRNNKDLLWLMKYLKGKDVIIY